MLYIFYKLSLFRHVPIEKEDRCCWRHFCDDGKQEMAEKLKRLCKCNDFWHRGQELYLGFIPLLIKRLISPFLHSVYVVYFTKSHVPFPDSVFSEHVQAGSQQGTTADIAVGVEEQLWKGYHWHIQTRDWIYPLSWWTALIWAIIPRSIWINTVNHPNFNSEEEIRAARINYLSMHITQYMFHSEAVYIKYKYNLYACKSLAQLSRWNWLWFYYRILSKHLEH